MCNKTTNTFYSSFDELVKNSKGVTKKEIAIQLDNSDPFFNYSAEEGLTSYKNYSREQLLKTCFQNKVNPKSEYLLQREIPKQKMTVTIIRTYEKTFEVEATSQVEAVNSIDEETLCYQESSQMNVSKEVTVVDAEGNEMDVRECSECHKAMDKGYCVNGGDKYYCSDECLYKHYTDEEWEEMCEGGDSESYWTEWR